MIDFGLFCPFKLGVPKNMNVSEFLLFSSPEHKVRRVTLFDRTLSVRPEQRPMGYVVQSVPLSVNNFFKNLLL